MDFFDLKHTNKLSLRTYSRNYAREDFPTGGTIYSEGAYAMHISYQSATNGRFATLQFLNGDQIQIESRDTYRDTFDLFLPGHPAIIRDDEIKFNWIDPIPDKNEKITVLFHRVVWKKDSQYYPAQSENKANQSKLNAG